jgi:hypothetical protein
VSVQPPASNVQSSWLLCVQLQKPAATGNALASVKSMRITDRMDLKATLGAVWTWNPRSTQALHLVRVDVCNGSEQDEHAHDVNVIVRHVLCVRLSST